ncbi:hypothetical protein G8C15_17235, partial [Enterococcus casseliflavus]|nr:hypothetical protein [Enterococcus casseliflavus]
MRKWRFLLSACLMMTFCFKTSFAETTTSESETKKNQVYNELSDKNEASDELYNSSNVSTRLSFNPPAVGQVGAWVTVGASTTDAEAKQFILNNYIPNYLGENVTYNGKLGGSVGDTLKLTLGASSMINLNYYSFNNPTYVPYVSWYGKLAVSNLSAKSSSSAVSVSVSQASNGNYEVTMTRKLAEKNENYEITLSYDYTLEYYVSMYISPPLGSGWSAWTAANTETIQSKSTTLNVSAEPTSDSLTAESVSQTVNLGTDSNTIDYRSFVTNVKSGSTTLSKNEYTVDIVDTSFDFNQIGDLTVALRVTSNNDSSNTAEVSVPVKVVWGDTIVAKHRNFQSTISAVSLLDINSRPRLVASRGEGFSSLSSPPIPILKIFDNNLMNPIETLTYTGNSTMNVMMDQWNDVFSSINTSIEYGNVISFSVYKWGESENYNGENTWVSRDNQLVRETEGFDEAYYELSKGGLVLLHINQLSTNSIEVPMNSSKEYLDEHVEELINMNGHEGIKVIGFSEYPDTSRVGEQKGKVLVEEELTSGGAAQYEYDVKINVLKGLSAETVNQTMNLGTSIDSININSFVKDVKFGDEFLTEDEYNVELVNNTLHTNEVGEQNSTVRITYQDEEASIELDVPVTIEWGNALRIKSRNHQTITGLALVETDSQYEVVATRGTTEDNSFDDIHTLLPGNYLTISVYNNPKDLANDIPSSSFTFQGRDTISSIYQTVGRLDVEPGDLVKIWKVEVLDWPRQISLYTNNIESQPYVD